jgi:hypothetical protein
MQTCEDLGTAPEPLITRTTKGVSLDGGVSLKNYGMGDKQVQAFAAGVGVMYIRHLDLSNNRIQAERTSCEILKKVRASEERKARVSTRSERREEQSDEALRIFTGHGPTS